MPEIIDQSDSNEPNQLALTTTSGARANNVDTNTATAHLTRHGRPLKGEHISFEVSGNAIFTSGGWQIIAKTDGQGKATVHFSDAVAENVLISCRYYNAQASEYSRFTDSRQSSFSLSVQIVQNGAWADGFRTNSLLYTVRNELNRPTPGILLRFSGTGGALLSAANAVTNASGQFLLSVRNNLIQQVIITAELRDFPNVVNHTIVYFIPFPRYSIGIISIVPEAPADGVTPVVSDVRLRLNNYPVSNYPLTITSTSDEVWLTFPHGTITNLDGLVRVHALSSTPGVFSLLATARLPPESPPAVPVLFPARFTPITPSRSDIQYREERDETSNGK